MTKSARRVTVSEAVRPQITLDSNRDHHVLAAKDVVEQYESLDALLSDLATRAERTRTEGGSVRVHPALLPEKGLGDYIAMRQRLSALGLRLVVTPAVSPLSVELRIRASVERHAG